MDGASGRRGLPACGAPMWDAPAEFLQPSDGVEKPAWEHGTSDFVDASWAWHWAGCEQDMDDVEPQHVSFPWADNKTSAPATGASPTSGNTRVIGASSLGGERRDKAHPDAEPRKVDLGGDADACSYGADGQQAGGPTCRWHKSANNVGILSADGHVFTKTAGSQKVVMTGKGRPVELSSICMVFDESLRSGGTHMYHYNVLDGELGVADGAGFVFDSQVRRKNIQRMRSVFVNQRGCICLRDRDQVRKMGQQLPPLEVGMGLTLLIDLDRLCLQFCVFSPCGTPCGAADVSAEGFFRAGAGEPLRSGFFCAVVTKDISVAIN